MNIGTQFTRYVGLNYSGAETPTSSLRGLRVYVAQGDVETEEIQPPPSSRKNWTRHPSRNGCASAWPRMCPPWSASTRPISKMPMPSPAGSATPIVTIVSRSGFVQCSRRIGSHSRGQRRF